MVPRMRLVLHIGTDKTGTTTLQNTFRRHRNELRASGVLYPTSNSDRWTQHQLLMCSATQPDRLSREFDEMRELSLQELRERGRVWWQGVLDQIEAQRPHTVILSYEGLFELAAEDLVSLREHLAPTFSTIDVVVYLRHPASHWVARAQQSVKLSWAITRPRAYKLLYRERLSAYVDVFGAVAPVAFDPLVLSDGDVVSDFLTRHIPDGPDIYRQIEVQNANDSMSAEAMCIMQGFWRHAELFGADTRSKTAVTIRQTLDRIAAHHPQTKPSIDPGIEAALAGNHDDDLTWLAERYGLEFPSFQVDPTTPPCDPEILESRDLRTLLRVDADSLEQTTYLLLGELAAGQRRTRLGSRTPRALPVATDKTDKGEKSVATPTRLANDVRSLVSGPRLDQIKKKVRRRLRSFSTR